MTVGEVSRTQNCGAFSMRFAKKFLRVGYKMFPICLKSFSIVLRLAVLGVLRTDQRP
jgi:hypothetical protein